MGDGMSTELDMFAHVFCALEPNPRRVRVVANDLDRCFACESVDECGDFRTDVVNGREVAICPECDRKGY